MAYIFYISAVPVQCLLLPSPFNVSDLILDVIIYSCCIACDLSNNISAVVICLYHATVFGKITDKIVQVAASAIHFAVA